MHFPFIVEKAIIVNFGFLENLPGESISLRVQGFSGLFFFGLLV